MKHSYLFRLTQNVRKNLILKWFGQDQNARLCWLCDSRSINTVFKNKSMLRRFIWIHLLKVRNTSQFFEWLIWVEFGYNGSRPRIFGSSELKRISCRYILGLCNPLKFCLSPHRHRYSKQCSFPWKISCI